MQHQHQPQSSSESSSDEDSDGNDDDDDDDESPSPLPWEQIVGQAAAGAVGSNAGGVGVGAGVAPGGHNGNVDLLDYSMALTERLNRLEEDREKQRKRVVTAASVGLVLGGIVSLAGGLFLGRRRTQ